MKVRIVVMGVSGCGKSSIGAALAQALGCDFRDGDDLHPAANVAKMAAGNPLSDDDRWPWLDRVAAVLADQPPVIVGCSALRRAYRDRLRTGAGGQVVFVHLAGSRDVIAERMAARADHFMPPSLLDSQFATLEPPGKDEAAINVDIDQPPDAIVAQVLGALRGMPT